MKISFLGTSHGITEKNQFCSSALISAGASTTSWMRARRETTARTNSRRYWRTTI